MSGWRSERGNHGLTGNQQLHGDQSSPTHRSRLRSFPRLRLRSLPRLRLRLRSLPRLRSFPRLRLRLRSFPRLRLRLRSFPRLRSLPKDRHAGQQPARHSRGKLNPPIGRLKSPKCKSHSPLRKLRTHEMQRYRRRPRGFATWEDGLLRSSRWAESKSPPAHRKPAPIKWGGAAPVTAAMAAAAAITLTTFAA
jgi:hypothetical protein